VPIKGSIYLARFFWPETKELAKSTKHNKSIRMSRNCLMAMQTASIFLSKETLLMAACPGKAFNKFAL
jgi:hypothetical protein